MASRALATALLLAVLLAGCAATGGSGGAAPAAPRIAVVSSERAARPPRGGAAEIGIASYYGAERRGRPTASGERFDDRALTAAHRALPFGTRVRVTNLANARSVVVTINDRGPSARGRVIDLSRRAAERLGFVREGTTRVRIDIERDATADGDERR